MKFAEEISFSVFHDSWETWNRYFRKKYAPKITLNLFTSLAAKGFYKIIKLSEIKKNPPENVAIDRLLVTKPEDAYPDKPRGDNDLNSIKFHMKNQHVSPIVIIQVGKQQILLDGMHRLVASSLSRKRNIPALILKC